ncbi:unnamed protein product, partial [Polarella glacialis]
MASSAGASCATASRGVGEMAPFELALREVHGRLLAAHSAALATVEGELQRMRCENTRLRMRLVTLEAGPAQPGDKLGEAIPGQMEGVPLSSLPPALAPPTTHQQVANATIHTEPVSAQAALDHSLASQHAVSFQAPPQRTTVSLAQLSSSGAPATIPATRPASQAAQGVQAVQSPAAATAASCDKDLRPATVELLEFSTPGA